MTQTQENIDTHTPAVSGTLTGSRTTCLFWIVFAGMSILFFLIIASVLTGRLNQYIYRPVDMEGYWATIPAGKFQMGIRNVYLDAFEIGRYEITNYQYVQCVRAGICNKIDNERYTINEYASHPVTDIRHWEDANTFCRWVDGRLPTEAEWEKAARGGLIGKAYPWGDEPPTCTIGAKNGANFGSGEGCVHDTLPIGSFAPNSYGLYDMAGNVWEWTADWYSFNLYEAFSENQLLTNPPGPETGMERVMRGGSWFASWPGDEKYLHVSYRFHFSGIAQTGDLGFRCAR